MEYKKTPNADLSKKRSLFFSLGLVISLGVVILLFERSTPIDGGDDDLAMATDDFEEEITPPVTLQPPPPPKPKPIVIPEIKETEEEVEPEEIEDLELPDFEEIEIPEDPVEEPKEEKAEEIFTFSEVQPEPVGGFDDWYKALQKNLVYPKVAQRMGVEGKVYLKFVVNKNGTIEGVTVAKSLSPECDEAAVKALKQTQVKWKPGKQRGKPVRVYYTLPVIFKLSR